MDSVDYRLPFRLDRFRRSRRKQKPNYKAKLEQRARAVGETSPATESVYCAEQVRRLASRTEVASASFQCVAAVLLQILRRVQYREQRAAEAAISLAQREKMDRMVGDVDETVEAIENALTPYGHRIVAQQSKKASREAPESSWWFALAEAAEELEEGIAQVESISAGLSAAEPVSTLGEAVAELLRTHHDEVLTEAERWMT